MKRLIYIIVCFCILLPSLCFALTPYQEDILTLAYQYGQILERPEIVQGIAYQETLCGLLKYKKNLHSHEEDIQKKYFGVCQIKLAAYYDVNRYFDLNFGMDDDEVIELLKNDDDFNLFICAYYLKYLYEYFEEDDDTWDKVILAYNKGMGHVKKGNMYDKYNYLGKVNHYIEHKIKKFNRQELLGSEEEITKFLKEDIF